ncbi:MAG: hypothetical protein ABIH23_10540 [bacterium]
MRISECGIKEEEFGSQNVGALLAAPNRMRNGKQGARHAVRRSVYLSPIVGDFHPRLQGSGLQDSGCRHRRFVLCKTFP